MASSASVLPACKARCACGDPADARQWLERSIRIHAKRANCSIAVIQAIEETALAAFDHIHRMTSIASLSRPTVGIQKLQAPVLVDPESGYRPASSIGGVNKTAVTRGQQPARCGLLSGDGAADDCKISILSNLIRGCRTGIGRATLRFGNEYSVSRPHIKPKRRRPNRLERLIISHQT